MPIRTTFLLATTLCLTLTSLPAPAAETVRDGQGHQLLTIPAGEFLMGSSETAEDIARAFPEAKISPGTINDEFPQHKVRITKPFLLAKYEVTVGQFRRFTEATGYRTEAETDGTGGWGYNLERKLSEGRRPQFNWRNTGYRQGEDHPVVNVSYNDVQAYLRWLSEQEGQHYRLPTEAEWEYAARAGSTQRYAGFDDPAALPKVARVIDLSRHHEFGHVQDIPIEPDDPTAFPAPVGLLAANAWGLHDMQGNVWEWVSDWHGDDYYANSPVDDPQGPASGHVRVRRGGGWNSFPIWLRTSFRNINTPGSRCLNLGFRVARDL